MKWTIWTTGEALSRTSTKVLLRFVGVRLTAAETILASMVVGTVQAILGFIGIQVLGRTLRCRRHEVVGAITFGVLAYVVTVLSFMVFMFDGDVGVNTLITTLSIIPGGLIDTFVFRHTLRWRQWFAIMVATVAGYSVLGWPSLTEALALPLWVWLSFITMLLIAANQGVSQAIKDIDPLVKNVYGGGTQVVCAFATLVAVGTLTVIWQPHALWNFWILSALIGVINVGLWIFNILSYRDGASIAIKKLVMNGVHLSTAMVGGILLFNEPSSPGKFFGVALYLIAFSMWDQETWAVVLQLLLRRTHSAPSA